MQDIGSRLRWLVCEGKCNPARSDLDQHASTEKKTQTSGVATFTAWLTAALRRLNHTCHIPYEPKSEDVPLSATKHKLYTCVECGSIRKYGWR